MLSQQVHGKGYASEAIKQLIQFAFQRLQLSRVQARCVAENVASEKVMQKSGMEYEGLLKRYAKIHGQFRDFKVYAAINDMIGAQNK